MGFVVPGEPVAVEEEAIPATGVYVDGTGYLRSMVIGLAVFDKYKKILQVKTVTRKDLTIKQGSLVEGLVQSVSEDVALIRIYAAENTRSNAIGLLHISQVSNEYVVDIYDYVKPSDIVKAKVLNSTPPYLLSIREPVTGIILAYCSNCGQVLYLHTSGSLVCKNCGKQEKRKTAAEYLYVLR
ncbi:MAG: exosome complex RNA-binding protein Csl4 [Desulfurococcaceae archaeon]